MEEESVVSVRSQNSKEYYEARRQVHNRSHRLQVNKRENQQNFYKMNNMQKLRLYDDDDTVVTGATSEFVYSLENFGKKNFWSQQTKNSFSTASFCFKFRSFYTYFFLFLIFLSCFLSPIVMVVLPKLPWVDWPIYECELQCESSLLALAFKLLILLLASWAIFFRHSQSFLLKFEPNKIIIVFLCLFITISFWFFYMIKLFRKDSGTYNEIVKYSMSLTDLLLFLNYLAVILLEIKRLQSRFVVKILRSPDGISKAYTVGIMSLQELALWCLHKYYADFQAFNPYLEIQCSSRKNPSTSFKLYNIDAEPCKDLPTIPKANSVVSSTHHEKIFSEMEQERRTLKRRYRLLAAADEAFQHVATIKANGKKQKNDGLMTSREIAEAIFPTLVRPLQKYLKATRQQPKYTMQNVLEHLTCCLSYKLSHKAFLEKYLSQGEVIWSCNSPFFGKSCTEGRKTKSRNVCQNWTIVFEGSVSKDVSGEVTFKLIRNNGKISNMNALEVINTTECLLVTVNPLPFFDVVEETIDLKNQKFILKMNTELTV